MSTVQKIRNVCYGILFGIFLYITLTFITTYYGTLTIVTYSSMPFHMGFVCKNKICLKNLKKGDIVAFRKYFIDKYIPDDGLLVKYIMCDEGDNLTVDKYKIYYCNGEWFSVAKGFDKNGNRVKNFIYNGKIPKGKIFVSGASKDSYDSKYFGFIDKDKILYKVYPIL